MQRHFGGLRDVGNTGLLWAGMKIAIVTLVVFGAVHVLSVVVSADHGGNTTDTTRPYIDFDRPFNTTGSAALETRYEIPTGQTVLRGTVVDASTARSITIKLATVARYDEPAHPARYRPDRTEAEYTTTYTLENVESGFRQPLQLGNGDTRMNITVVDAHGNYQLYTTTLHVNDTLPPTITRYDEFQKGGLRYVYFRARDDTNLDYLRLKYDGRWHPTFAADNPFITSGRVVRTGLTGNPPFEVQAVARDFAGNTYRRSYQIGIETPTPTATPSPTPTPTGTDASPTPAGGRLYAAGETPTPPEKPAKRPNTTIATPSATPSPTPTPKPPYRIAEDGPVVSGGMPVMVAGSLAIMAAALLLGAWRL